MMQLQDAPLKIAIRGGIDTPLGGQIIVSRIIEGGAAEKYGQLQYKQQLYKWAWYSMM